MISEKPVVLAARAEEEQIGRQLMVWVNKFPGIPPNIANGIIEYESLKADAVCMALSTIQGTYITRRYIAGGHQAEYQFKLIYRVKPKSSAQKLDADEVLDTFGDWAMTQKPDLGDGINVLRIEPTTRSALFAAYDNGDEDHQILMKLVYEVT